MRHGPEAGGGAGQRRAAVQAADLCEGADELSYALLELQSQPPLGAARLGLGGALRVDRILEGAADVLACLGGIKLEAEPAGLVRQAAAAALATRAAPPAPVAVG